MKRVCSVSVGICVSLLRRFRGWGFAFAYWVDVASRLKLLRGRKKIFFAGTPLHGNLGDHAIAVAMQEFFRRFFPEQVTIEVPGIRILQISKRWPSFFSKRACPTDIVVIIGGGFLGTLWMNEELMVRATVKLFPGNRITIFPQTIFFEKSVRGDEELAQTRKIYQEHEDLHLCIRDKSIGFVRDNLLGGNFKDVISIPDIVLLLDRSAPKFDRRGVLLCFRADKEKVLSGTLIDELSAEIRARNEECIFTDTVVGYGVSEESRNAEVEQKFDEFRRARLVVTDRLHGMIFAAITGTPCIALNNSSGKVEGVYSMWLQHLPYVKFVQNESQIAPLLDEMLTLGGQHYDSSVFEPYWEKLATTIRGR